MRVYGVFLAIIFKGQFQQGGWTAKAKKTTYFKIIQDVQNPQVIHIYIRTKDIKEDYFMISTYQGSGFHQALIQYANLNKVAVQSGDSSSKAKGKVSKIAWMLGLILIAIVGVISFVPNDMPQGNNIVDEPRFLDTIPAIDYTLGDVLTNEPVIEGDRVKLISNFIEVDLALQIMMQIKI